jgi:hypothetical protein
MTSLTLARIAIVLVLVPCSRVCASDQTVQVAATLVAPAIVTTEQAVERLFQRVPGVLTISLPPVASSATGGFVGVTGTSTGSSAGITTGTAADTTAAATETISVIGAVPSADGRGFVITASNENTALIDRLAAQFEAGPAGQTFTAVLGGEAASSTFVDGNGFKLVIVGVTRNADGSGYISALIPFN